MAQEVRARDLSIVEDVLVEAVQGATQAAISAVNTENLTAQESARADQQPVPIRYLFRAGGQTQARGMFLRDYGAVFTVQVPSMSYTPSGLYSVTGNIAAVRPEAAIATARGEEMQMRAQLSRMGVEVEVLSARLEQEIERSGETAESTQELRTALQSWQTALDQTQRAYTDYMATRESAAADDRRRVVGGTALAPPESGGRDRLAELRVLTTSDPEDLARAEELATDQKNQVEGAIINAVVEVMTQYGRIMHGLDDDDRLAVVLLPSSYLNPVGSWLRATERDQEFIISVRFGDILDFDRDNIDKEEFRRRIRVERRSDNVGQD